MSSPGHEAVFGKGSIKSTLANTISDIADLPLETIDDDIGLGELGFNSLHYTILSAQLSEMLNTEVSPTALFDLPTLDALTAFVEEYRNDHDVSDDEPAEVNTENMQASSSSISDIEPGDGHQTGELPEKHHDQYKNALAIVGVCCRMPKARGMDEFWENLKNGRDCIEEVPASRWNWKQVYGADDSVLNATYANQGGFIENHDCFDAEFFRLSPREAEIMDPRQRVLLEGVWHTLEDAGYKASDLKGSDVGVFIGACGDEYANLLIQADHPVDSYTLTGNGRAFISNRISYFFDWTGPSEVIDTTCSSSLVAMHNAQQAINSGTCSSAIVGGVSILIDPYPQISLSRVNVLADDCRCKTFDSRANGYVRSEGMGLVMVKSLQQAIHDNDNIYAVIRGGAVNHGGHSSALTAPNSKSQSALIASAYRKFDIDVDGLGYLEAHGTGTQLGDPIEVEGIKNALKMLGGDQGMDCYPPNSISLGSVKTAIGHCEAAAGIAGLLKLILTLKHQTIPPVVHLGQVNDKVHLENTPLYLSRQSQNWPEPVTGCRKGGVSAFGFGGVNAHVVVEEYKRERKTPHNIPLVLPVSARNPAQLKIYVNDLYDFLSGSSGQNAVDVAYTFQMGRESMPAKVVFLGKDLENICTSMNEFLTHEPGSESQDPDNLEINRAYGQTGGSHGIPVQELVDKWLNNDRSVDWGLLYEHVESLPGRVSCPVYPFKKQRLWPESLENSNYGKARYSVQLMEEGRYQVILNDDMPYIRDHTINGVRVLPGAAYISIIEDLTSRHLGYRGALRIRDLVWEQPIRFDESCSVAINILVNRIDEKTSQLRFVSVGKSENVTYCSAKIESAGHGAPSTRLDDGRREFEVTRDAEENYRILKDMGIDLGKSLQTISRIWMNEDEAFSDLRVSSGETADSISSAAGVEIVDGILQTAVLHQNHALNITRPSIPFSIRNIYVYGAMGTQVYVRSKSTRASASSKTRYNFSVFNIDGEHVLEVEGAIGLPASRSEANDHEKNAVSSEVSSYREVWSRIERNQYQFTVSRNQSVTIVLRDDQIERRLAEGMGDVMVVDRLEEGCLDTLRPVLLQRYKEKALDAVNILVDADNMRAEDAAILHKEIYFLTKELLHAKSRDRLSINMVASYSRESEGVHFLGGIEGFGNGLNHEYPRFSLKTVYMGVGPQGITADTLTALSLDLDLISSIPSSCSLKLDMQKGDIYTRELSLLHDLDEGTNISNWNIEKDKVYLISGGLGRVGSFIARHIVSLGGRVVLMGRRKASDNVQNILEERGLNNDLVEYRQMDMADMQDVYEAIDAFRRRYSGIGGVVHCAGVPPNALLINKDEKDYYDIYNGKMLGAVYLDRATKEDDLGLFFVCSSLTSLTGHVGCTDYALANRCVEKFAQYRTALVEQGKRKGKTACVAWPAWQGGMKISDKELAFIGKKGFVPLNDAQATAILNASLSPGMPAVVFYACGEKNRYDPFLRSLYLPSQKFARQLSA